MEHFSPPQPAPVKPIQKRKKNVVVPVILLVLLYIVLVLWMNFPITRHLMKMDPPTITASVTPTNYPTLTPRPTFTPTITPTITPTPLPASQNQITDINNLNPPINGLMPNSILMDINDATVTPPLNNPQWYPGTKAMPGKILTDSIYITQGSGSVTWKLDVPLAAGLYQIFVMDTVYGSAGSLNFVVNEGSTPLAPLTDGTLVNYESSQSEQNPQYSDEWHSIGVFNVTGKDLLSINSVWGPRDPNSLVALDRVIIEPLPATNLDMLNQLDPKKYRIVVDDLDAKLDGNPLIISRNDSLAWNGKFQSINNPEKDVKATYTMPYTVLPGQYEVFFWSPATHHSGVFDVTIKINGKDVSAGKLATVKESDYPGGKWISLGTYDSSSPIYGNNVIYSVTYTLKGGSVGETGLDAIAFLGPPQVAATPSP